MKSNNTKILTFAAVMLALATVLSLPFLPKLPYGGTVTLCGMLPIILVGYLYGKKWGLLSGLVFSLIQLFLLGGLGDLKGVTPITFIGSLLLDFILAFTVLGLSGMYKNKIKSSAISLALGAFTVLLLRYLFHFLSGIILFGQYAEWFFTEDAGAAYGQQILAHYSGFSLSAIYSAVYNGLYMIPEIVLTTAVALIIGALLPKIRKENNQ